MSLKLLIVDDSRSLRKVMIKVIRMCHIGDVEFLEAGNGIEGLDVLAQSWVDMIFTDINMPEMDGFTFVDEVRKNDMFKYTPIVVITSETRSDEILNVLGDKVAGLLHKPFRPEEVREYLTKLLDIGDVLNEEDDSFEGYDF